MTYSAECKLLEADSATSASNAINSRALYMKKVGSALFYGVASFLITVVNKTVLTSWKFPSFLALSIGQMVAGIVILAMLKQCGVITYADFSKDIPKKLFPLPLMFFGNMMFGLGGTQALPLPMFTAIRRFSILMTMMLEFKILSVRPSKPVQFSVWCMVGGALLAASDDLTFSLHGYTYVMITNVLTAANGVLLKKKLDTNDIGKNGIMFYNSVIMLMPAIIGAWVLGDFDAAFNYEHWTNPLFFVQFFMSCVMGFVLSYSILLCTQFNSALTTTIIGCLKNICVTYLGMFIGDDYKFSWLNFIGINISVLGSLLYTYITFGKKETPRKVIPAKNIDNVYIYLENYLIKTQYTMIRRQLLCPRVFGINKVRQLITSSAMKNKTDIHRSVNQFPETVDIQNGSNEHKIGEPQHDYIHISNFQRLILSVGSSVAALVNPHRHDMIACLGETTGIEVLQKTLQLMKVSPEGSQILAERPRINSEIIDLNALGRLPTDTFGYAYKKFLDDNNVTPDSRMPVKFLNDPELMYVMTRYRECHDLIHTVLGMPTNMLGEVTVKWIEAINIGLPMCYGGAVFGAMRLRPKQRENYRQHYLPWALNNSKHLKPLMNVYWEKRWDQKIDELRKELNIEPLEVN
ncbi:uncharacterized protein LOC129575755 [Sitodiplosis mosellana]|uniref:uncharacterized protein LOC129575755 n=1 Tax=Sitodiplosis mosellana TaxID=263140 RepID=UPI00244494C1|nr:uncharacterized protein LOC129575755 [Sitodiplosis mosellana]